MESLSAKVASKKYADPDTLAMLMLIADAMAQLMLTPMTIKISFLRLAGGEAWRYEFNPNVVLEGGLWITLNISIVDFPLFQRISTYL